MTEVVIMKKGHGQVIHPPTRLLTSDADATQIEEYVAREWPGWTIYSITFHRGGEPWTYYPVVP